MGMKITLIVESTGHDGGENTMKREVRAGSDNPRYYPSQLEHAGVTLIGWAKDRMTNLVGSDRVLVDHDAKMVVNQRAHLAAVQQAQAFRDLSERKGPNVIVDREVLAELNKRSALLRAMEEAGVNNWEGMDHVVHPKD